MKRLLVVLVALVVSCGPVMAMDVPKEFLIEHVAKYNWGRLASVYDQPAFQRLTFESDTAITIVQVGLAWDNRENAYFPSVRQIITISKGDFSNTKGDASKSVAK